MGSLDDVAWPRRTERLVLRRAVAADAAAAWTWGQRPDVTEWLTARAADEATYTARFVDPDRLARTVMVELDGTVVGLVVLQVGDALAQLEVAEAATGVQAEIGWDLHPDVQGRGYATEAAEEVLRIAFEDLGLRRVWADCFADNVASWRMMERLGMRREMATRQDTLHRTRGWLDWYVYAVLADEWRSRQAREPRT